ncbi:MAG: hypothetical protein KDA21_01700, partial [Phycisphaerales bacterium]|nr:hypothetical protein [Phycisphaerales bacterium]
MKWFRSIKTRLARRDEDPRLTVATFGKHPAFPDHIESGIGTMTPAIRAFKQRFYNNGIKPLIDSGAWRDKPEERLLPEFDHQFVALSDSEILVGRFWSSRDSRGRAEYPFVAVVQAEGVPVHWTVEIADAVQARLRTEVGEAQSESDLQQACRDAQEQLDQALAAMLAAPPATLAPRLSEVIERFFREPALGPDAIGFRRALHMIDDAAAPRARGVPESTLQLRMPRADGNLTSQLVDWSILLLETLSSEHAV